MNRNVSTLPLEYAPRFAIEVECTCVVCPGCAFTFDQGHADDTRPKPAVDTYTCPLCGTKGLAEDA